MTEINDNFKEKKFIILYEIILPKINYPPKIGYNGKTTINFFNFNVFATFVPLQALLVTLENLKKHIERLYKYYVRDILEYNGNDDYIIKLLNNIEFFNYGFEEFEIIKNKKYSSGSSIDNYTSIFSLIITENIFDVFKNKTSDILIKFPSTVSRTTIEYLILLSYIFEKVTIIKSNKDSLFRDSFYIHCIGRDISKTIDVKAKLDTVLKEHYSCNFLYLEDDDTYKIFSNLLIPIQDISQQMISIFRLLIETELEKNKRNDPRWEFFDNLNSQ